MTHAQLVTNGPSVYGGGPIHEEPANVHQGRDVTDPNQLLARALIKLSLGDKYVKSLFYIKEGLEKLKQSTTSGATIKNDLDRVVKRIERLSTKTINNHNEKDLWFARSGVDRSSLYDKLASISKDVKSIASSANDGERTQLQAWASVLIELKQIRGASVGLKAYDDAARNTEMSIFPSKAPPTPDTALTSSKKLGLLLGFGVGKEAGGTGAAAKIFGSVRGSMSTTIGTDLSNSPYCLEKTSLEGRLGAKAAAKAVTAKIGEVGGSIGYEHSKFVYQETPKPGDIAWAMIVDSREEALKYGPHRHYDETTPYDPTNFVKEKINAANRATRNSFLRFVYRVAEKISEWLTGKHSPIQRDHRLRHDLNMMKILPGLGAPERLRAIAQRAGEEFKELGELWNDFKFGEAFESGRKIKDLLFDGTAKKFDAEASLELLKLPKIFGTSSQPGEFGITLGARGGIEFNKFKGSIFRAPHEIVGMYTERIQFEREANFPSYWKGAFRLEEWIKTRTDLDWTNDAGGGGDIKSKLKELDDELKEYSAGESSDDSRVREMARMVLLLLRRDDVDRESDGQLMDLAKRIADKIEGAPNVDAKEDEAKRKFAERSSRLALYEVLLFARSDAPVGANPDRFSDYLDEIVRKDAKGALDKLKVDFKELQESAVKMASHAAALLVRSDYLRGLKGAEVTPAKVALAQFREQYDKLQKLFGLPAWATGKPDDSGLLSVEAERPRRKDMALVTERSAHMVADAWTALSLGLAKVKAMPGVASGELNEELNELGKKIAEIGLTAIPAEEVYGFSPIRLQAKDYEKINTFGSGGISANLTMPSPIPFDKDTEAGTLTEVLTKMSKGIASAGADVSWVKESRRNHSNVGRSGDTYTVTAKLSLGIRSLLKTLGLHLGYDTIMHFAEPIAEEQANDTTDDTTDHVDRKVKKQRLPLTGSATIDGKQVEGLDETEFGELLRMFTSDIFRFAQIHARALGHVPGTVTLNLAIVLHAKHKDDAGEAVPCVLQEIRLMFEGSKGFDLTIPIGALLPPNQPVTDLDVNFSDMQTLSVSCAKLYGQAPVAHVVEGRALREKFLTSAKNDWDWEKLSDKNTDAELKVWREHFAMAFFGRDGFLDFMERQCLSLRDLKDKKDHEPVNEAQVLVKRYGPPGKIDAWPPLDETHAAQIQQLRSALKGKSAMAKLQYVVENKSGLFTDYLKQVQFLDECRRFGNLGPKALSPVKPAVPPRQKIEPRA